jgi:hypothetical protein
LLDYAGIDVGTLLIRGFSPLATLGTTAP